MSTRSLKWCLKWPISIHIVAFYTTKEHPGMPLKPPPTFRSLRYATRILASIKEQNEKSYPAHETMKYWDIIIYFRLRITRHQTFTSNIRSTKTSLSSKQLSFIVLPSIIMIFPWLSQQLFLLLIRTVIVLSRSYLINLFYQYPSCTAISAI